MIQGVLLELLVYIQTSPCNRLPPFFVLELRAPMGACVGQYGTCYIYTIVRRYKSEEVSCRYTLSQMVSIAFLNFECT